MYDDQDLVAPARLELSWILPLYGTAQFVGELMGRIRNAAAGMGIRHEVLLVDDACPAGSGAEAERIAVAYPEARVLRLPRNLGQDSALREGLRACTGEWAVLLDADLQDPPEAVAELWRQRAPGVEAVFAHRVGRYTTRGHHASSRLYRAAIRVVGGLPRGACLFVLLHRPLVEAIASTRRPRISILATIAASRRPGVSIPVPRSPRPSGRSAYGGGKRLAKAAGSLWQMLLARHLRIPL